MNIDTLIHAGWVIPVDTAQSIHKAYSLAINDGNILDLLPTSEAREKYAALDEQVLTNHAIIPGLINSHTHAAMSLFRGLADDLPLMDWLNNHIWPAEQRWVSAEFVREGTQLAIAEMLRGGTTCFNDMYFFPDRVAEAAIECSMRAVIGLILIDFPTVWAKDADEYILKGEQVFDKFRHNPLISACFAPHAPYTVSDQPLQRVSMIAEEINVPIHMHVHETEDEVKQSLEQHGKRPLQRLQDLGLINERLLAVHMTQLQDNEIELVSRYGVSVLHCPESNLKLASGFCPVADLINAGVNVALGTDGAASNNDLDMLGEMRTAALLGKGVAGNSCALPAYTVLEMATIRGAKALGIADKIGSLEAGKAADLVAIDLSELETTPLFNPVSQVVYSADRHQVTDVWVAGKQLLKERELMTINQDAIMAMASDWQNKITETN
jgi:5-methylthioadenosine/S-adenosylhomocysteine deaminase